MTRAWFVVGAVVVAAMGACGSNNTTPSGTGMDGGSGSTSGTSSGTSSGSGTSSSGTSSGITDAGGDGGEPTLLSQAGLFSDIASDTLAPGVYPYHPTYALWSDGALKRRWVYLPPGKQIDTSDMNFWWYPVGTKLFKEFTFNGVRVETRMLEKIDNATWYYIAFQWNKAQTDAVAVPDGVIDSTPADSMGVTHDIPAQRDCQECHDAMQDHVLGFTALQLAHTLDADAGANEVNLAKINSMGWLNTAPPTITLPGDAVAQEAIGYLHANCGICHNEHSRIFATMPPYPLNLWQDVMALTTVQATNTYMSAVCVPVAGNISNNAYKLVPGSPTTSAIYELMSLRATMGVYDSSANQRQMPPLATKIADPAGVAAVAAWINELGKTSMGCPDH
jgi:hypothetical protein